MIEILSEDDLKNRIKKGVTLADFSTPWCAPCLAQEPILSRLEQQFEGKLSVLNINIDIHREIAMDFCIKSIPVLIVFKNGKELQRFVGLQPESVLSDAVKRVLIEF